MQDAHRQRDARLRLEWGLTGARTITADVDAAVVVDVLSFTTTLSVALDAGSSVWPYPWDGHGAPAYARDRDAVLALGRAQARAAGGSAVSLSPATMRGAHVPARLVLPSPNGSRIAFALAEEVPTVVAVCLRNTMAVARWLTAISDTSAGNGARVAVVAAGERWPDGSLRPAVEDLWGAGALIAQLALLGWSDLSVEAAAARAAYEAARRDMQGALLSCASGQELVQAGYRGDVEVAAEVDTSSCVPLMRDACFTDQSAR